MQKKKSLRKKKKVKGDGQVMTTGRFPAVSPREGTQSPGRGRFSYRLRDTWCKWQCRKGLESQGEGRQSLNPLLVKTLNRVTLKYW